LVWSVVCFTLGFHRLLGLERRRPERIVLGVAAAYTLALCLTSPFYAFALTVAGGGIAVVLALYLLLLLIRHPSLSGVSRRALLLPAGVGAFFGIHDLLLVGIGRSPFGTLLSPYIPVVAIGATGWLLLERHLASMRETEALNAELEARVASKHRELEANYERLRALESWRPSASASCRTCTTAWAGSSSPPSPWWRVVAGRRSRWARPCATRSTTCGS
jgi:hypothetical protein